MITAPAWVLLVLFYTPGSGQPITVSSSTFWTRDTCQVAQDWLKQQASFLHQVSAECFLTGASGGTADGKPIHPAP